MSPTRAKPWKCRGWIVSPAENGFHGTFWRVELDPDAPPFPRTCHAMEIPCGSYRERSRVRHAIRRDRLDAIENERRRREREERDA